MFMTDDPEPILRIGTYNDIPWLAIHHRKMFEEIWDKKGSPLDQSSLQILEETYTTRLHDGFMDGSCSAWVICKNERIISSGAVSICTYVPNPHDLSSTIAFLHSIYSEQDQRGHGFAQRITQEAMNYCRTKGIKRLYLFASDEGRPLYEMNGFSPVENMMMQFIS